MSDIRNDPDVRTFVSTATGEVIDLPDVKVGDLSSEQVTALLREFFPGDYIGDFEGRQDHAFPSSESRVKVKVGTRPLSPLERLLQLARDQRDLLLNAGYDEGFDTPEDCDDFECPDEFEDPRFLSHHEEVEMKPEYVKTKSGFYVPKDKVKDTSKKPVTAPTEADPERDTGKEGAAGQRVPKPSKGRFLRKTIIETLDEEGDSE